MYVRALPFAQFTVWDSPKPGFVFFDSTKPVSESRTRFRKSYCNLGTVRCGGRGTMEGESELDDGYYMRRCVELARKAVGCTSPNPMVGCVIVKDGRIVGEGFHPKAGQPHAEVFAIRDAGELAENGTAYVSLEPCNHYGRTPPCTDALINAKVRSVVVGMVDPNPIVASTGIKKLQEAGIKVKVGVEEEMCKRLNEAFVHRMLTGNPFVTLRYSMSLDGYILNRVGEEAASCGGYYSKLLQEQDAVILSSTALAKNSLLPISIEPGANQPLKFVISKFPNLPTQISADISSKLTILSENGGKSEPQTVQEGIQLLSLDRITLPDVLEHCKHQGACSVLLDLTGDDADFASILAYAFEHNLIQKALVEVLPCFGGSHDWALKHINLNQKVKSLMPRICGNSILLEGYF